MVAAKMDKRQPETQYLTKLSPSFALATSRCLRALPARGTVFAASGDPANGGKKTSRLLPVSAPPLSFF
jgi:hypothetical protein